MFKRLLLLFKGIGKFLLSFALSPSAKVLDEIGSIAYDIALRIEKTNVGEDKFTIVKRAVVDELIERSVEYTTNLLNTGIEMSVLLIKDNGKEVKYKDSLNQKL